MDDSGTTKRAGISLGSVIAVCISWGVNKSILWAIIHGVLGWIYVFYFLFTKAL